MIVISGKLVPKIANEGDHEPIDRFLEDVPLIQRNLATDVDHRTFCKKNRFHDSFFCETRFLNRYLWIDNEGDHEQIDRSLKDLFLTHQNLAGIGDRRAFCKKTIPHDRSSFETRPLNHYLWIYIESDHDRFTLHSRINR